MSETGWTLSLIWLYCRCTSKNLTVENETNEMPAVAGQSPPSSMSSSTATLAVGSPTHASRSSPRLVRQNPILTGSSPHGSPKVPVRGSAVAFFVGSDASVRLPTRSCRFRSSFGFF